MIVCSFLPAATRTIHDLGLSEMLYGVSFECPPGPEQQEVVVRCQLPAENRSSRELDRMFSQAQAREEALYSVDAEALQRIAPDLIFTQDICSVCQLDQATAAAAIGQLPKLPILVSLSAQNLKEVFADCFRIGSALGHGPRALAFLRELDTRLDLVRIGIRKAQRKKIALLEWMDPLYSCGHWIPDQIAQAGGCDDLSHPGGYSSRVPWQDLLHYDPEILVIAPCGFPVERTLKEAPALAKKRGWNRLRAVRNRQVFLADAELFTQPSAGSLTDGIELLAHLIHPGIFPAPHGLEKKWASFPYSDKSAHHA